MKYLILMFIVFLNISCFSPKENKIDQTKIREDLNEILTDLSQNYVYLQVANNAKQKRKYIRLLKINNMKFGKIITLILTLLITIISLNSCEDDCTKMVNIPIYNPNHGNGNGPPFIDNFQEVPCDYEEPVTEPVN